MGSLKLAQKRSGEGRRKKVTTPLDEQLKNIEWGEYRIGDLFESTNGDFDIQKNHINGVGEYVITAGVANCGILGKTDVKARIFSGNTITIDMFGNAYYRAFNYKLVTHARVFSLEAKFFMSEKQGLFFANSFRFLTHNFGYENMCSWSKIKDLRIQLPTKNGEIDFEFMNGVVAELESKKLAKLEAYLNAKGFKDCKLTKDEEKALELKNVTWGGYRIGELFEKINTKNVIKNDTGDLPATTAILSNNQIGRYISRKGATVLKNVFSATANGFGRAFYQPHDFTVLQDSYAFTFIDKNIITENIHSFVVSSLNMVYSKYNWGNKSGWNKIKDESIQLPTKNGEIDFEFMQNLIQAIQKLVIKDVVDYVNKKGIKTQRTALDS